jgi:hypothetical protein
MAVECGAIPVNLVEDTLHWRVRYQMNDVDERVRLAGLHLFRRLLGETVKIRGLIVQ